MPNKPNQKGKVEKAEGAHGPKTRAAFIEGLHQRQGDEGTEGLAQQGSPFGANPSDGKHRLVEEREQHDEAEKNSELQKTNGSDPAR
jgi:hypothetical protein